VWSCFLHLSCFILWVCGSSRFCFVCTPEWHLIVQYVYIILFIFVQMYIWGQPRSPNMNCIVTSFAYDRIAFQHHWIHCKFGLGCISINLMAVVVWFHDIGVHIKLALFLISIFTEPAHSLFNITFRYTTFLERTCLACLISILNGSVFWFHGIGIHVNLALLLSALPWAHRIGLRIKSEKIPSIRGGWIVLFFEGLSFGCWHFDWFSILISLNWRARQVRSFTFGITLSTEQGCPYSLQKIPLSGEVELFSFFEGLSFGSCHFDWFVRQDMWTSRQEQNNTAEGQKTTL